MQKLTAPTLSFGSCFLNQSRTSAALNRRENPRTQQDAQKTKTETHPVGGVGVGGPLKDKLQEEKRQ